MIASLSIVCSAAAENAETTLKADSPDYIRDIRPILADHCFNCHGGDEGSRKGKLRLDVRENALKGGGTGEPAIVPGHPELSALIERVVSTDEEEVMPPLKQNHRLSEAEVGLLRDWIAAGAEYKSHWAFVAPQPPRLPAPGNPIDALVRDRLRREGIKPAPAASPDALCRRLHLDITGLPPALADLDRFVVEYRRNPQEAVRHRVDALLASPHYGEKWARHWLDAARYADSDGYEKDLPRLQWAWRDWVIEALNRDMPYDQFIVEQVAGDELPGAGETQRVATGFLRNGMINEEGAVVNEQFRIEGVIDRIDTLGKSVLGLTFQCAQCHSHKYDPIKHTEYYGLFAYLNNTYEQTEPVYSPEQQKAITRLLARIADGETKLKQSNPGWSEQQALWEQEQRKNEISWHVMTPIEFGWVDGSAHPDQLADGSVISLGYRVPNGQLYVTGETTVAGATGLRLEALTHPDLALGGPGRNFQGTFAITELVVEVKETTADTWRRVELKRATADYADAERPLDARFRDPAKEKNKAGGDQRRVGPVEFLIDKSDETAWTADRGPGLRHSDLQAVVQFSEPLHLPPGTRVRATVKANHGGPDIRGLDANFPGRVRISLTDTPDPVADILSPAARRALHVPEADRSPDQAQALFTAWRTSQPGFSETNAEIAKLWNEWPSPLTTVLSLAQRSALDQRNTRLLERGVWDNPGKVVTPHVPLFLHPMRPEWECLPDRLALARWLTDRSSPTTARVAVNRVWQAIFGDGLVETPDDFGVRSPLPTHPELLDWLALSFMESGWSQKHLLREIFTSDTYRQNSSASPEALERDPRNRLLGRGPRFRADAEVVRDIALSVSGLLNPRVGGPSAFAPMPANAFAESYAEVDFWKTATGAERYVRSLYVFRRRTLMDPVLASFDAPTGEVSCVKRDRSNTPLAALATLNETIFSEAARALALRVLREGQGDDRQRLKFAWRLCTARDPQANEVDRLEQFLAQQRRRLVNGEISAREIAPAGVVESGDAPATIDAAVWTMVARVLLNLDETLTKG